MRLIFICIFAFLLNTSWAAEFIGGEKSTDMRWYTISPPHPAQNCDAGLSLEFNLPISKSMPRQFSWENAHKHSLRFAPDNERPRELSLLNIAARIPITDDGSLFLAWQPILRIEGQNQWKNAHLEQKQTNKEKSVLEHNAWLNSNSSLNFSWEALTLAYKVQSKKQNHIEVGLVQHSLKLNGSTTTKGDWVLHHRHVNPTDQSTESFSSEWHDSDFHSLVHGDYQGDAWPAFLEIKLARLSWRALMSTKVEMLGVYSLRQNLPYFMHGFSLKSNLKWESPEARDSLLLAYKTSNDIYTDQPIYVKIPTIHHLSLQIKPWVQINYIYFNQKIATEISHSDVQSKELDLRQHLALQLKPNHLSTLNLYSKYGGASLGAMIESRSFVPLINAFVQWHFSKISTFAQWEVLPIARLNLGLHYGF
ncbi:MAG: hypothetical protein GX801_07610 [Fibrobacter sp.]|nr:hypothetical protein [Fibrobacter sp.]